jgi:hypothetical protein
MSVRLALGVVREVVSFLSPESIFLDSRSAARAVLHQQVIKNEKCDWKIEIGKELVDS